MKTEEPKHKGPACGKCHWWCFINSVTGHCKRMPPAADFNSGHFWPITGRGDWCGEFRPHIGADSDTGGVR